MRCYSFCILLGLVSPGLAEQTPTTTQAPASKKATPGKFIRLEAGKGKADGSLQTAIVRYLPASGANSLTVDLIAAVHVGD